MIKLLRIIFLFILMVFLVFLLIATFLSGNQETSIYNFEKDISAHESGYYVFSGSGVLIQKQKAELEASEIYIQKISQFYSIYAREDPQGSQYRVDGDSISLGTGEYLIDTINHSKNIRISGQGFEIESISSGKTYIDTRDSKNTTIFSLGSTLKLSFLSRSTNESITSAYIFPNRYIAFDTRRNNELKGADFLRISQVMSGYRYLDDSILQDDGLLSARGASLVGDSSAPFLNGVLGYIKAQLILNQKRYIELGDLDIWQFPGANYIQEKLLFFKNDTKKIVFYKNLILGDLDKLLSSEAKNMGTIRNIIENLSIIEDIDTDEYNSVLELINYYSFLVFSNYNELSQIQKQNFILLLGETQDTKIENLSLVYLSDIYTKYNLYDNDISYLQDIALFNKEFFSDFGVQINNDSIVAISDKNSEIMDYFASYLQGLITKVLFSESSSSNNLNVENLAGVLAIINDSIRVGKYTYFRESSDQVRKQTGLYQNLTLLMILEKFLRKNLFKDDRDDSQLLQVKQNLGLKDTLTQLKKNTDSIFDLYTTHKTVVGKNINKLKPYSLIQDRLYEYFLATSNNDRYIQEFDSVVSETGDTAVFNGGRDDSLSQQTFLRYISNFSEVITSGVQVEVVEGKYYRVQNLGVRGRQMSFELYPLEGNMLESITIDNKSVNGSYNLDEREFDLEEKFKIARSNEKDKYDFRRFFVNTFFAEQVVNNVTIEDDDNQQSESKIIIAFKKEKLLGPKKEFSFVNDYLPLVWEQVKVEQGSNNYDISIVDGLYLSQETRTQYHAQFNSKYIFSDNAHQFEEIIVKIYDRYTQYKGDKFALGGTEIRFIGDVAIDRFNEVSEIFFEQLINTSSIYNILSSKRAISDIKLSFYTSSGFTAIDFSYNGADISMNLSKDTITYIKKDGKTVANSIKTSTLADILDTL